MYRVAPAFGDHVHDSPAKLPELRVGVMGRNAEFLYRILGRHQRCIVSGKIVLNAVNENRVLSGESTAYRVISKAPGTDVSACVTGGRA